MRICVKVGLEDFREEENIFLSRNTVFRNYRVMKGAK